MNREQFSKYVLSKSRTSGGNVKTSFWRKAVIYGNYLDLYIYHNVQSTFTSSRADSSKSLTGEKRSDSITRSRNSLFRLVQANIFAHGRYQPIFGTFTFSSPQFDSQYVNRYFSLYCKRLSSYVGHHIKYVVVTEKHESGAFHLHAVFFNLPRISFSANDLLWGQGKFAVKLEFTRRIKSVSSYIAKYLRKDFADSRPLHSKLFRSSHGLIKPYEVINSDVIDTILSSCKIHVLSTYQAGNFNQIKYKL